MNKLPVLIVCLCMLCLTTKAQTTIEDIEEVQTEGVVEVHPDTAFYFSGFEVKKQHLDSLKKLNPYSYVHSLEKYLRLKKAEAQKKLIDPSNTKEQITPAKNKSWFNRMTGKWEFNVMLWLLAAFFIIMILYFFLVRNRIFSRETKLQPVNVEPENEEVPMHDFEKAYLSAKIKNDYRLAIKFLFLHTLFLLSEKEIISFSADKTNYEYLLELPVQFQKDFAVISLAYEYIWYGRQPMDADSFSQKEVLYFQFINRIQQS